MIHGGGALVERAGALSIMVATPASLAAEDSGGAALADHLGLETPTDWPPEHNDAETRAWLRNLIEANPDHPGCGTWYIVVDGRLVGICGYKGPPNDAGEVEIGYSVLEHEQRRGYASAAVGLLIKCAFRNPGVLAISAETLPSLAPSIGVLEKHTFKLSGSRMDPELGEVIRYCLARP